MTICAETELPIRECGCPKHHRPESTVISLSTLERLAGHPLPQYRAIQRPAWRVPTPKTTRCEHRKEDLCPDCDRLLDDLLADLPNLVEELGFAMRKDVRFAPHGYRQGDVEHPDEAPIPWSPVAAGVLGATRRLMADPPQDRRLLLPSLSRLAERAHRVIERPKDRQTTMCPRCGCTITVPDDDPAERSIICPVEGCAYSATWAAHLTDLLDANGEALLTAEELRFVLIHNGEPISRFRIQYLVTHHGLPREQIAIPRWKHKRLITEAQFAYRLRDVRDLEARLAS